MSRITVADHLKQTELFSGFAAAELDAIVNVARRRAFEDGEQLIAVDDSRFPMFVITSGRVKVHRTASSGVDVIFAIRGEGQLIGELSAIDGRPRSADVSAMGHVEAIEIGDADFRATLNARPTMWRMIAEVAIRRLRQATDSVEDMVTKPLIQRLALTMIALAKEHGDPAPQGPEPDDLTGVVLPKPLTTNDLAEIVGNSRVKVNTALSDLIRSGVVVRTDMTKALKIVDGYELARIADGEQS